MSDDVRVKPHLSPHPLELQVVFDHIMLPDVPQLALLRAEPNTPPFPSNQ